MIYQDQGFVKKTNKKWGVIFASFNSRKKTGAILVSNPVPNVYLIDCWWKEVSCQIQQASLGNLRQALLCWIWVVGISNLLRVQSSLVGSGPVWSDWVWSVWVWSGQIWSTKPFYKGLNYLAIQDRFIGCQLICVCSSGFSIVGLVRVQCDPVWSHWVWIDPVRPTFQRKLWLSGKSR